MALRAQRRNRGRPAPGRSSPTARGERWLYGRHPVEAALANPARRWRRLAVAAGQEAEATVLIGAARATRLGDGDAVRVLDRGGLAALLPDGAVHQGLALDADPLDPPDLGDVLRALAAPGRETAGPVAREVMVVLDQVTDPQNVGAILRAAAAFGARAVIVPAHGAPAATGAMAKAASGALELVPLIHEVNLARALDRLKEAGFWCCGLDERAPDLLAAVDLGPRAALVLGAEGDGLRRLVRERCDHLARLPTTPRMPSLNVSAAAAVALYAVTTR